MLWSKRQITQPLLFISNLPVLGICCSNEYIIEALYLKIYAQKIWFIQIWFIHWVYWRRPSRRISDFLSFFSFLNKINLYWNLIGLVLKVVKPFWNDQHILCLHLTLWQTTAAKRNRVLIEPIITLISCLTHFCLLVSLSLLLGICIWFMATQRLSIVKWD